MPTVSLVEWNMGRVQCVRSAKKHSIFTNKNIKLLLYSRRTVEAAPKRVPGQGHERKRRTKQTIFGHTIKQDNPHGYKPCGFFYSSPVFNSE